MLSRPFRIYWSGWEAESSRLQQMGWELSAEEMMEYRSLRIIMRHREQQLYCVSEPVDFDYFDMSHDRPIPPVQIQWMANKVTVNVHDDFSAFKPIDAYPQIAQIERKSIEDFSIFATPLVRTEEIIVEPETVSECMEIIKRIQKPEQDAIREKRRFAEAREGREIEAAPRQKFHAQILSIV